MTSKNTNKMKHNKENSEKEVQLGCKSCEAFLCTNDQSKKFKDFFHSSTNKLSQKFLQYQ